MLLTAFLLLLTKKPQRLINVYTLQSLLLAIATFAYANITHDHQLYFSAALTVVLKVIVISWLLRYLIQRLQTSYQSSLKGALGRKVTLEHSVKNHCGQQHNFASNPNAQSIKPLTTNKFLLLIGAAGLLLFCYHIIYTIPYFPSLAAKNVLVVALAITLFGMLIMLVRREALTHVIGFMEMENGLFFAAVATTQGMPMVVELGIAFDVLVATILFGIFFFQIHSNIDSLDIDRLNRLREDIE